MSALRGGTAPKSIWRFRLALVLLPVFVLAFQDNSLFAAPHNIDTWLYLGYFRNLAEYKVVYRATYYGSRLTWILPGWAVNSLLSPVAASYVLHLVVHLTATLSLFGILRRAVSVRAAFVTALVFSLSPQLNAATGSDYIDGAGIAYCLLGMSLLSGPRRSVPALVSGGAALAACVYTNLFWIVLMPAVAICCVTVGGWWRSLVRKGLWAVAGAGVLTAALCVVNHSLDGLWWFYEPSTRAARDLLGKDNFWFHGLAGDYGLEPWLWIPVAALALAVATWGRLAACGRLVIGPFRRVVNPPQAASLPHFSLAYLAALAAMCFFQFVRKQPVLGLSFYADYLLPFAFLVIGTALWDGAERMSAREFAAACAGAAVVSAAVWADWRAWFTPIWPAYRVEVAAIAAALLGAGWALRARRSAVLLALAAFALSGSELRFASGMWPKGSEPNPLPRGPHEYRRNFERVMAISNQLDRLRGGGRVYFWYDENEPNRSEYWAINAVYMFVQHRIGANFPKGACGMKVEPGSLLVIATGRPELLPAAREDLAACWSTQGLRPAPAAPDQRWEYITPYTLSVVRAEQSVKK